MLGNTQADVPQLAWARGWGRENPPAWAALGIFLFGLAAVIMVPYTISAASDGMGLQAVYGLVGVLLGGSFVIALLPLLRVRRRHLPDNICAGYQQGNSSGLRILYAKQFAVVLWLVSALVFLVLRGLLFFSHLSDSDSAGRSAIGIGGIIVVVVAVALAIFMISYFVKGKRRRGSVLIDSSGLTLSFGSSVRTISWTEIGSVSPCVISNSRVVRINPIPGQRIQVSKDGSLLDRMQRGFYEENLDLHAHTLRMDPPLLFHLVTYYWRHPGARPELASDAVIDRMQRGDLLS